MIRDEAPHLVVSSFNALEQPLRHLHRPLGREPELAAGFLRQRRCGERRCGSLDARLLLERRDRPWHVGANGLDERSRLVFTQQPRVLILQCASLGIEVFAGRDAPVAEPDERGDELASFALELRLQIPIDRGTKCPALFLALDDQTDGNALDTSGAESGLHFLPEQRRQGVAVQAVENTAAFLCANEILVHVRRVLEGLFHRVFRDLVEDDAAHGNLRLEDLLQVPTDRLTLAVRVGGQQQFRRLFHRRLEMRHLLSLVRRDDVVRREVLIDIHTQPAPVFVLDLLRHLGGRLREIANVAIARLDSVLVAEKAAENLRLGGRFNDDEGFTSQPLPFALITFALCRDTSTYLTGGRNGRRPASAPSRQVRAR